MVEKLALALNCDAHHCDHWIALPWIWIRQHVTNISSNTATVEESGLILAGRVLIKVWIK